MLTPETDSPLRGSERFHIVRRIGAGGMGVVYEAYDKEGNARVALKTLSRLDPDSLYHFKKEFRSLAHTSHSNLVSLYELFSHEGEWFFSMEFVEGVNLMEFVRPGWEPHRRASLLTAPTIPPGLDWMEAPTIPPGHELPDEIEDSAQPALSPPGDIHRLRATFYQLTEAVLALHAAGILHRDLKPLNVKVTPEGRVVVLDFGLVASIPKGRFETLTANSISGTVPYMSPEQAAGRRLTEATDWYSVGVMLYEALTGWHPYRGHFSEILADKQRMDPPAPANLMAGIPEDLNAVCMGLLRRDPQARITGKDLLAALEREAGGRPETTVAGSARNTQSSQGQAAGEKLFVGRESHLAVLREAFRSTERNITCAVYLHGKSGMGKSSLVERFLGEFSGRPDVVILAGRCYEQESVPYKAFDSVVDSLTRYIGGLPRHEGAELIPRDVAALAQVFPVLRRVDAVADAPRRSGQILDQHELRRKAFGAMRELLARLGDRKRLILSLDDLQWGDVDSALLLREILRPPEAPVLLLIGAYRSEHMENSLFLQALLAESFADPSLERRDLPVDPLTAEEARMLASQLLSPQDRSLQERPEAMAPEMGSDPDFFQDLIGGVGFERDTQEESGRETLDSVLRMLAARQHVTDDRISEDRIEAIARESGGSPYFVQELIGGFASEKDSAGDASQVTLDSALWRRIGALPENVRRLLEIVAVSGQPLGQREAYEAAQLETRDPKVLAILRIARLIRSTGPASRDELEAYHDRVRETVVAHLDAATLKEHHLRLATVLESSGSADAESVAIHFEGGGENEKAGHYYAEAAEKAAAALAFKHAAALFQRALELRQVAGEEHRKLHVKLADALANAGRGAEAARTYQEAAGGAGESEVFELKRRAAFWFVASGNFDEGREAFAKILRSVNLHLPPSRFRTFLSLASVEMQLWFRRLRFQERPKNDIPRWELDRIQVAWDAARGFSIFDSIYAAYFVGRCLLLALRAGALPQVSQALSWKAAADAAFETPFNRRHVPKMLELAAALAEKANQPYNHGFFRLGKGIAAFAGSRWRESLELLQSCENIFRQECTGVSWELGTVQIFSLWDSLYLGRYVQLCQTATVLSEEARERGDLYVAISIGSCFVPFGQLVGGSPETALKTLEDSLQQFTRKEFLLQHACAAIIRTWIYLYRGEGEKAWKRINEDWPKMKNHFFLRMNSIREPLYYVRAQSALAVSLELDNPKPMLRQAEGDARELERGRSAWPQELARLIRAGCAAQRGDRSAAIDLLEKAAAGLQAIDSVMMAAATRWRLGEFLGGDRGRDLMEDAENAMKAQGVHEPARLTAGFVSGFPRSSQG